MRYHHIGIPTDAKKEGMVHVPELGMFHSPSESNPFSIIWVHFDAASPVPELIKRCPHVAFAVNDLEGALEGRQVLVKPTKMSDGSEIAFICHSEAPVAFIQFADAAVLDVPSLATRRLVMRPINTDDTSTIFQLRSNPKVMKFMDHLPMASDTEAFDLIFRIASEFKENATPLWAMAKKTDPKDMIGYAGYIRWKKSNQRAEIACLLDPLYWRMGLATEALTEVIRYGFETMELHSVEAKVNPNNLGAVGLLKRLGFVREALFKEELYFQGTFVDSEVYSLLDRNFSTQ